MRSRRCLICAIVGLGWLASLRDKSNARSVGHEQEWLFVCALDVKQNPACVRPIDLGCVQQHLVHALRPGESPTWNDLHRPILDGNGTQRIKPEAWNPGKPLPNAGHLASHTLRLWAKQSAASRPA